MIKNAKSYKNKWNNSISAKSWLIKEIIRKQSFLRWTFGLPKKIIFEFKFVARKALEHLSHAEKVSSFVCAKGTETRRDF